MQRNKAAIDFAHVSETVLATILRPGVLMAIVGFLTFNLLVAYLLYLPLKFEGRTLSGSQSRLAHAATQILETIIRTAGLKGAGGFDSAPDRILEIFMAVVGTALSATISGVLTSAFVGAIGEPQAVALTRLPKARIATLQDSTLLDFLIDVQKKYLGLRDTPLCVPVDEAANRNQTCLLTAQWVEAVELLSAGRVDMVLGDWVQLTCLADIPRYAGSLSVQGRTYLCEPYGWGISPAVRNYGPPSTAR